MYSKYENTYVQLWPSEYSVYLTSLTLLQVVVKTRTEYQTEKKRLKVPKVEEFTISFTDGVSERLKVRGLVGLQILTFPKMNSALPGLENRPSNNSHNKRETW